MTHHYYKSQNQVFRNFPPVNKNNCIFTPVEIEKIPQWAAALGEINDFYRRHELYLISSFSALSVAKTLISPSGYGLEVQKSINPDTFEPILMPWTEERISAYKKEQMNNLCSEILIDSWGEHVDFKAYSVKDTTLPRQKELSEMAQLFTWEEQMKSRSSGLTLSELKQKIVDFKKQSFPLNYGGESQIVKELGALPPLPQPLLPSDTNQVSHHTPPSEDNTSTLPLWLLDNLLDLALNGFEKYAYHVGATAKPGHPYAKEVNEFKNMPLHFDDLVFLGIDNLVFRCDLSNPASELIDLLPQNIDFDFVEKHTKDMIFLHHDKFYQHLIGLIYLIHKPNLKLSGLAALNATESFASFLNDAGLIPHCDLKSMIKVVNILDHHMTNSHLTKHFNYQQISEKLQIVAEKQDLEKVKKLDEGNILGRKTLKI